MVAAPADAAERLIVRFDDQTSAAGRAGAIRAADARTVKTLATGARVVVAPDRAHASRRLAGNGIDDDGNGKVDDTAGWSFTSDSPDVADDHGHGTHVAGTTGAAAGNGEGIAGVAPNARLMTVKVLAADGTGWTSDIADGFDYAAREGADVVNASLGGSGWSAYLRDAIARHPDVVLVAAAGNDGADVDSSPQYPCAYDLLNVVCVASHDNTGALSSFSNFGDVSVDLAAPGRDIVSWLPGGSLAYASGTSMATPHVAGAAAPAASAAPGTAPEALRDALVASARRSSALAGSSVSGGALDAAALLTALEGNTGSTPTAPVPDPPPPTDPTPPVAELPPSTTPTAPVTTPDRRVRLRLTSIRRRTRDGRALLRVRGRSSAAGTVRIRACRRSSPRRCSIVQGTLAASPWTMTVRLGRRVSSARLAVHARLTTGDGRRAAARQAVR